MIGSKNGNENNSVDPIIELKFKSIKEKDSEIFDNLRGEIERQRRTLELIASENYAPQEILEALGTVFTNKYSEGYPGKRFYAGQLYTDRIEEIAIQRAKKLFKADHANVQPLSGALANWAVYLALLEEGDCVLSMKLDHGGHLTHGSSVSKLRTFFKFIHYGLDANENIDYVQLERLAYEHKPKIILVGYSAYTRDIDYARIKEIATKVGALCWADIAHIAGLIAGGQMRNPLDYGFEIITGTTHKTLRGPRGGFILTKVSKLQEHDLSLVTQINNLIDKAVFPGIQGGPLMNVILAKAITFGQAMRPEFKEYAAQVVLNAKKLADELISRGCLLLTGGTENHMIIINAVKSWGISGGEAQKVLEKIGLITNKNAIPNDDRSVTDPSGLRLGTPAATTRGLKEKDMEQIAIWIDTAIKKRNDENTLNHLQNEVSEYLKSFPIPV